MGRSLIPFVELFMLLGILFIVQFVISAALDRAAEKKPADRLFLVSISGEDEPSNEGIAFLAIGPKSGSPRPIAAVWPTDSECSHLVTTASIFPLRARSKKMGSVCEPISLLSEFDSIISAVSQDAHNDLNSRINGLKADGTPRQVSVAFPEPGAFNDFIRISYKADDIDDPLMLQIGFCPENLVKPDDRTALHVTVEELGKVFSTITYRGEFSQGEQLATISGKSGSLTHLPSLFRSDDCSDERTDRFVSVATFSLDRSGVQLNINR